LLFEHLFRYARGMIVLPRFQAIRALSLLGVEHVFVIFSKPTWRSGPASLAVAAAIGLWGCGPEGAGTIKVDPGTRSRIEPPAPESVKRPSSKQAKVKELEEEARKKDPKRF
jgi:hypothetical protein